MPFICAGIVGSDGLTLAPAARSWEEETASKVDQTVREEKRHDQQQVPDSAADPSGRSAGEQRPWPVKALTWLLFFQAVGLIVGGLLNVDLRTSLQQILIDTSFFASLPALGVLALVAAIGFLRPRPGAWVVAMLVEGLNLLLALLFYFRYGSDNFYLYAIMVYAIFMVLYLNYAQVPTTFRRAPALVTEVEDE